MILRCPGHDVSVVLLAAALEITAGCSPTLPSHDDVASGAPRTVYDLDSGWVCRNIQDIALPGGELARPEASLAGWLPATVPGTVLTTLLNNGSIPDPLFGMNGRAIPDISDVGRDRYTYWFARDLTWSPALRGRQVWLDLRGVNYGYEAYLNGRKLTEQVATGMFLRRSYNITALLSADGKNRLAILVYPPDPVGGANGGQGGDGTIGRSVTNQYVAGWDWIQPVADRNSGIWDKVSILETGSLRLRDPLVEARVPGRRFPGGAQESAYLRASLDVENPTDQALRATVRFVLDGHAVGTEAVIPAETVATVQLPELEVQQPDLWWPNGYGEQHLSPAAFQIVGADGRIVDEERLSVGIREIQTTWNSATRSRQVLVNGQPIFIKGGNWITSDVMLRLSPERYDAQVRLHRDMNLNLIRIWGGGITERPEFYEACDRYGLLVFQDLWISGDCNGKWLDPKKKEDQWIRRGYPDDHALFLRSVADQVRMLRVHPSLAFYCGGNEMPPPEPLLHAIQDSLLPLLDRTRYFFTYSNADSMSNNFIGGNGDGAYGIQPPERFWSYRSFPFNSEIGSVGLGDDESLARIMPPDHLVMPDEANRRIDSVWRYHKYLGYGGQIGLYGQPMTLREFTDRAQLVNYDQYRALMEGHLAHMWEWYTGIIIWKTANPWTALRGEMFDHSLDPNAGLYGLRVANEPLHVMHSPVDGMLYVVNNTFRPCHDLMVQARTIDVQGRDSLAFQWFVEVGPSSVQKIESLRRPPAVRFPPEGGFLGLRLLDAARHVLSENLYWIPDTAGSYSGMQHMPEAAVTASAKLIRAGRVDLRIENRAGGPLAFFQRVSLVDRETRKRILPVFTSDNYVSVWPGSSATISLEYSATQDIRKAAVSLRGWNVREQMIPIAVAPTPSSD